MPDRNYDQRERGDFRTHGDWGPPHRWASYGNRPDYDRENEWFDNRRVESDFGGADGSDEAGTVEDQIRIGTQTPIG